MKCASALSTMRNSEAALREVLDHLEKEFQGIEADLAIAFCSMHHADVLGKLGVELMARRLGRHVLGCTGETVIGNGREIESEPALSVWVIQLDQAEIQSIRIDDGTDGLDSLNGFTAGPDTVLLLGDPFSFAPDPWLQKLQAIAPGLRVMGGMASASQVPRQNRLLLDGRVFDDGAVGVALGGSFAIRSLVSQGCRPIGRPLIVTRAERNMIRDLGRRPCLEVLREIFEELPEDDQERVQSGLHIGRVINEYQESFRRGDFLVRNVMGADESGGIAITDFVKVGQTVQFHVRDAETADEDLRTMIDSERIDRPQANVAGALIFSCNGRGSRLFDEPDHDVGVLQQKFGPIPVAGFFAMGEIGPVGGQNFVHGYTASVVLFEEPTTIPDDRA
jgi:small ligand-binding sensory domain FIST